MRLRSLTKHVKDQNWFAVALDFFIVVVGILIAFQITNWNEARINKKVGNGYVERLIVDLENDAALWKQMHIYYQTTNKHAVDALGGFREKPSDLGVQFLIDLYQASQRTNTWLENGTYEEILSTGRIDTIADENARNVLANFYGRKNGVRQTVTERTDYRQVLRELMDQRVQSAIRENCDDKYVRDVENFVYLELPLSCDIKLPVALVRDEIARLHSNQELRRKLRFHHNISDSIQGSLANAENTAQTTVSAMKKLK